MVHLRSNPPWLLLAAGGGILAGLFLGLVLGWLFPISSGGSNTPATLSATDANRLIVLVASSYAQDGDIDQAKSTLKILGDAATKSRIERLAKTLSSQKSPDATAVADLAVGLGSTDSAVKVLAASVTNEEQPSSSADEPTRVARAEVEPSATAKPTQAPTQPPPPTAASEAPTEAPTVGPTKTKAPTTVKPTSAPQPTSKPAAAAALYPEFKPTWPSAWPGGTSFTPASVAAGQQYWRLKSAQFCDVPAAGLPSDTDTCPGMPGGPMDHTIYISVLDAGGGCAQGISVKHLTNTGDTTPAEQKQVLYPWNSCQSVDYEWNMYGEGNAIWIEGNGLPSDKIDGMVMNSPQLNWSANRAHVRYFLIFQLTTR